MEKREKIVVAVIIVLIILGIGLIKAKEIHDNSVVDFADETMGQVLCNSCNSFYMSDYFTLENITYNDLKTQKLEIDIGYIGYYDTLIDLKYCTGVKQISINSEIAENSEAYFIKQGELNQKVSKERVEEVQQELRDILPKMKELKWLIIGEKGDIEWSSIEFLKNQKSIEDLSLYNCKATDYSVLKTCISLKKIRIEDSDLSKADDLIGLKNVEYIYVYDTPLAENPKEIKKLQEAYPEADICY